MTTQDDTCTLRLRLWTAEDDQPDPKQDCLLQQRVDGRWLDCGEFYDLEAAMKRAKDASLLLDARGMQSRKQYRLVDPRADNLPFSYFDVLCGHLYPGTAPIAQRA